MADGKLARLHNVSKGHSRPINDAIFSPRAVLIGAVVAGSIVLLAMFYKFAVAKGVLKPPQLFEFSVADPQAEDIKLKEVARDILMERPENASAETTYDQVNERPNIHFTTNPATTEIHDREVIQSSNTTVETTRIDVGATEINVDTGPAEISAVTDVVQIAIQPIAVDLGAGAAGDFIKYKDAAPRGEPGTYFMNTAPRPGRAVKTLPKAYGDQNTPGSGQLGPMNINLNGTGLFFRNAPKYGDIRARTAIDGALHWLALHQETDGMWRAEKYEGGEAGSVGVTGLACLAFMGAGHTTRKGDYCRQVNRGIDQIIKHQRADGGIGNAHLMYTHAICTIALCEAYGRAKDERYLAAAQKAVAFIEKGVNPDGGWRYTPNCGVSDVSVTAWVIQALKTARLAKIKFSEQIFSRAQTYLDSCTDKGADPNTSTGGVAYQFAESKEYGAGSPALTAAGMMIRQFLGLGIKNPVLVNAAKLTRNHLPKWTGKDFYTWYYSTYAMHNMGGEDRILWNKHIRDVLFENQTRTGEHAGSWDPKGDKWGTHGGRVYTTALGALCLEVYYRYSEALNSFGAPPDFEEVLNER